MDENEIEYGKERTVSKIEFLRPETGEIAIVGEQKKQEFPYVKVSGGKLKAFLSYQTKQFFILKRLKPSLTKASHTQSILR
jgi:hypothetical protein